MRSRSTRYPFFPDWLLAGQLVFLGISALYGGYLLVVEPSGQRLQMSTSILEGTPFHDFRLPGLFLFFGLGIGALLPLPGFAFRSTWFMPGSGAVGAALLLWILVQVLFVGYVSWLQPFYALLGVSIIVLAILARHAGVSTA